MGWPGEQLLSKLWETLADKGVGSLLKPGQMRREGLVNLELERAKLLNLAQTEKDAEDIRNGRKEISDLSLGLKFAKVSQLKSRDLERKEPIVNIVDALEVGRARLISDAVRREINTAGSIIYAEQALCEDASNAPEENINDDWLYRWRDYTGEVSDDDLQKIWGRLLAGEVKNPGTYSLRTLDFLRSLSQAEAVLIEKMVGVVVNGFIWRPIDNLFPVEFRELLVLQELGIIIGADSIGLEYTLQKQMQGDKGWVSVLSCHDRCLIVRGGIETFKKEFKVNVMGISNLGTQVMGLGDFKSDLKNLEKLGRYLNSLGCKTSVAEILPSGPEIISWKNEVVLD